MLLFMLDLTEIFMGESLKKCPDRISPQKLKKEKEIDTINILGNTLF